MELSTFATSLAVAQEAALDRLGGWSHSICSEQYGRPFALGLQHGVYIFFGGLSMPESWIKRSSSPTK